MTKSFRIEGMSCDHCAHKVKMALEELSGVTSADVALDSLTAEVEFDREVDEERLSEAIGKAGYTFAGVR